MRKIFSKFHLWVSVPFGLVITITCFTGALLVFEDEATALCGSGTTAVYPDGEPQPLNVIAERVAATLPDGVEVKGVEVSASPDEAYKVNLSKPKKAVVYVNQYSGEIIGRYERLPFFQTVFRLHRWLMDSAPADGAVFWGRVVVGTSTLAFVVILLTGLVIWWPRNGRMFRNRLHITVNKGGNRFWYDLHVVGGFYALLLLLAMALTGLNWSFEWYREAVYGLFGAGNSKAAALIETAEKKAEAAPVCQGNCRDCTLPTCVYSAEKNDTPANATDVTVQWSVDAVTAATNVADTRYIDADAVVSITDVDAVTAATIVDAQSGATSVVATQETAFSSWQKAFDNVELRVPKYKTMTVTDGTVSVKSSICGNIRAADKYLFDNISGEIIGVELYKDSNRENRIAGWFYSVHIGAWGGVFTRILSFLAALLGATLPLTGYYFWIRRLYGKRKGNR